ncbi:MAG: tetratricopeptide repeat protein [SAR202 cluster bacterium]|nr:tetratricopeptide repeat protein [SAR202 cluster bacterium]
MSFRMLIIAALGWLVACTEQALSPEDIARNDRGVAQMGRYEYKAALATFAEVVERSPEWLDARVNLAIATLNRQEDGDEVKALEILSRVVEEDANQLRALYTSGLIYLNVGEPQRAVSFFNQVTVADPEDAYAAYFLGQSHMQAGDFARAAEGFLRALDLDPYLRSAYWAGALAHRRIGSDDRAATLLADYQRFADNPAARVAGFSYKRMGPKAEALATGTVESAPAPRPGGELFSDPHVLDSGQQPDATVTTADIDGDGQLDLLLAATGGVSVLAGVPATGVPNAGTVDAGTPAAGSPAAAFKFVADHPLALAARAPAALIGAPRIRAALWGDVNDDGHLDVVLCGDGGSRLWLQTSGNEWQSTETGMATPCAAGALFDADHDGDLDLFVTGPSGNELLSNNRDGSFRQLAAEMGLSGHAGRQVLVADLDTDRDLDILVVNVEPPNDLWQNDRTWQYEPFPGLDDLRDASLLAVTAADTDADGHVEIYAVTGTGDLAVWRRDGSVWQHQILLQAASAGASAELSIADFDGDGRPEILLTSRTGFALIDPQSGEVLLDQAVEEITSAIALPLDPGSGPAVVTLGAMGLQLWPAGPGRHPFLALEPSGRSQAEQMRSNASGIGTRIKVRTAGRWTLLDALDPHSGPGQSLAPLSVGLGGHARADFVALEWSDGVSQTEIDLEAGQLHQIAETQRQLASCPVVFTWDGRSYRFISDVLGVGGLGFFDSPGVFAPPRPFEGYLIDATLLRERDGRYHIKVTEPMEENAYIDAVRIHVYDLPTDWMMVLDERMEITGPPVSGRAITYRRSRDPVRATGRGGDEVTGLILTADHIAPPPGEVDHRFIGLLAEKQVVTLEFDPPLDAGGNDDAVLIADGWIEYPYSQTVFAAWQAGVRYEAPTLEARGSDGLWHAVAVEFGYPAGMPRQMALPLPQLPPGTDALRLSSNMEIYWDRLQVAWEEPLEGALRATLTPVAARVAKTGFARRTTGAQRLPHYDYGNRSPYWDAKFQRGFYTALGDATELVTEVDAAVAIIGGGEEIHVEFEAIEAPAEGMRRYFVLDFRGWAKDMDLYTDHGETVGPLPIPDGIDKKTLARRERLHEQYNVRFQEGL